MNDDYDIRGTFHTDVELDPSESFQNARAQRRSTKHKGPYILGSTLGEGAFGKVKVATHMHTKEKVAIKILDKGKIIHDEDDVRRVQKEINIFKKLRHKNIIQLYEVMESRKNMYIVMEYCENKELFDHIVSKKRLNDLEACKIFHEIIDGVEYLHSMSIVHRDLKPENILLDYKNSIKISDFGLSTTYIKGKLLSTPCGTPSYAPPEMLRGDEYNGLFSDVWSCGIILYAMLCGFLPFAQSREDVICQKIMEQDYEMPDYLSPLAVDLINNILKIEVKERYDFEKIKAHPWFNLAKPSLRPGLISGYHKIPIDENILDIVEQYGISKEKCKENLENGKFDSITSVYHLCLKKYIKQGGCSISDMVSEEYLRYINDPYKIIGAQAKEQVSQIPKELKDMREKIEQRDQRDHSGPRDQRDLSDRRDPADPRDQRENNTPVKITSNINYNASTNRNAIDSETNSFRKSEQTEKDEKKDDNIKLNLNLNVNLNVNTTNNINFPSKLNTTSACTNKKGVTQVTNDTTISHKTSNSTNIDKSNSNKIKPRIKEYSSSITSPVSIRETSFINNNNHSNNQASGFNTNSNKNSFLSSNTNAKKDKKVVQANNPVHNQSAHPSNVGNYSSMAQKESKQIPLRQSNTIKDIKKIKTTNEKVRLATSNNNTHSTKSLISPTIQNHHMNHPCSNSPNTAIISNKHNEHFIGKPLEKEISSCDNLNWNLKNNNNESINLSDNIDKLESTHNYEDDLNEEDLNKLKHLKGLGTNNVLELIANKLLKSTNFNIPFKKDNIPKKSPSSVKSNNNSFIHNRSTSLVGDHSATNIKHPINNKNKKAPNNNQFGIFIGVLNQELKKYYETQNQDIIYDDLEKDEKDDVILYPEFMNSMMNSTNNNTSSINNHLMNSFISAKKEKAGTLKKTKFNKFNKINNNKLKRKNYKNEEEIRDKLLTKSKQATKFLDISTNYDPDLDSRNESSVDRSTSQHANLRNLSFSPDVIIKNNQKGVFHGSMVNSYTQSILQKTKKEINLNILTPTPLLTKVASTTTNKLKSKQSGQIGVISEDDEFNHNYNVSLIKAVENFQKPYEGLIKNEKNLGAEKLEKTERNSITKEGNAKSNAHIIVNKDKDISYKSINNKIKLFEKKVTINLTKDNINYVTSNSNLHGNNKKKSIKINENSETNSVLSPFKSGNKNCYSTKNIENPDRNIANSKTPANDNGIYSNFFNENKNKNKNRKKNSKIVNDPKDHNHHDEVIYDDNQDEVNSIRLSRETIISNCKSPSTHAGNFFKERDGDNKHRKTSSAYEFNSSILNSHKNDLCISKSKHQRNKSQINELDAVMKNKTLARTDNASFVVKNTNDVSLVSCINKNDDNLYSNTVKSRANPFIKVPVLNNLSNLNKQFNSSLNLNIDIRNNDEKDSKGDDQEAGNTERDNIKDIIEEFYFESPSTRSEKMRNNSIFDVFNKEHESLKTHYGPVDLSCITNIHPVDILEKMSDVLSKKKISFANTMPFKLRCSKIGISFDIEIMRLEDTDMFYIKFKFNQKISHMGEYGNFRKLIHDIMTKFKSF